MLKKIFVFLAIILLIPVTVLTQSAIKLPKFKYQDYKLKNGLRIILHEDKSTPIVSVNFWYHVGGKDDPPGKSGFAHLFEHMMFAGSKNYDARFSTPLQEAGGRVDGTTDEDRTYYYETIPSNFLELALYLEADRMGNLAEAITQQKLDNVLDVVKNERRQRIDNVPGGTMFERINETMYPAGHPYHRSAAGSIEDISAATLDDVRTFFHQYYVPNNAVLVIAGDFNEKQTRGWIEKYFGSIKRGADIVRQDVPMPHFDGEVRKTFEDSIRQPRIAIVWHTAPQSSPDYAALKVLNNLLPSSDRMNANMRYGKQLGSNMDITYFENEIGGFFKVEVEAAPGKTLDEIEKEITFQIERLKKEPPTTEETIRARRFFETGSVYGLQTIFGKASQLSENAGFLGNPDQFQANVDSFHNVTPADIQRVVNKYFTANRLVMSYLPRTSNAPKNSPPNNQTASPTTAKIDQTKLERQIANLPKPGADPKIALPPIEKLKLSNGLSVWLVKQKELPIVSMNLVLKTGAASDPVDKTGIATMTAAMINQGTKAHSQKDILGERQLLGMSLRAEADWDSTAVSMQTLNSVLDESLELYADVITNPVFPAEKLEDVRRNSLNVIERNKTKPTATANMIFNKLIYDEQPYGRGLGGSEQNIKAITRNDILKFYEGNFRPNNAVLIVVGDFNQKQLLPKLEKAFGNWKSGKITENSVTKAETLGKAGIYLIDKPGAPQSSIYIGQVGASRNTPDYYALQVMNSILGETSSGRLFKNLREDKGYTYGAYSQFAYRRAPGPFSASAEVQTQSTKEAIDELLKELNGIRGAIPVTSKELEFGKQSLIRNYPSNFETDGQISNQLSDLVVYNLPDYYFNDYIQKINAITLEDVNRVANKYLDPLTMVIVVVGDRKSVEMKLKELSFPIEIVNADGNPVEE